MRKHTWTRVVRRCGLILAVCGIAATAVSGDTVVAKALLESGKKALAAKKYDEAVPLFRKAVAEDPTLIESVYWRAQAHEKSKEDFAALAAYREFLGLLATKVAAGGATAEDQKLKPLAEKRVEALAIADREFQKIEDKFVADLLAIAKARVASDPGAALTAADTILKVVPKHAEALALRDRLSGKTEVDPFAGVESWRDMIGNKEFHSDAAKFVGDILAVEMKGAGRLRPEPPGTMGTDYAGEMEFRVAEAFEQAWILGFFVADSKDGYYALCVERAQVRLLFLKGKERPNTLKSFAMAPLDPSAWHRLAFIVRGRQIQVFLDGEIVLDENAYSKDDSSGDLGIFLGACRAEFRKFRTGSFK